MSTKNEGENQMNNTHIYRNRYGITYTGSSRVGYATRDAAMIWAYADGYTHADGLLIASQVRVPRWAISLHVDHAIALIA